MKLIAVAETSAGRAELTLTLPEEFADGVLDTGEARQRLQLLLNREVQRCAEVATVARRDAMDAPRVEAEVRARRAGGRRGPDQVAFAGSRRKAVAVAPAEE